VFAGLLFSLKLFEPTAILTSLEAFLVFCALSGVVYLLNDVMDRETDRRHPTKCTRPIAAGDLPVPVALVAAAVIGGVALAAAFELRWQFGAVSAAYVGLQALYSTSLKHLVILDVLTIAIGFVLRAVGGAVVLDVVISHWLLVCMILLALFIALAKRRHELVLLADDAISHRPILGEYSAETEQKFGTTWLGLTIPFPLYGIFRYLYLVHRREGGGSPADLLLNDRPLLACVTFWVVAVVLIIYHPFVP
jgi:hypothetical protein